MKVERYVLELPDFPVMKQDAAERIVKEIITMTAEANIGLDRETLVSISREYEVTLHDMELYIDRLLTILYNTNVFSHVVKVSHPLSNVDVEVAHRQAFVEIAWNDRINKSHP
ncbi:hypothetical protein D3C85_621670 [compost metagenome]